MEKSLKLYCPHCGNSFNHFTKYNGKVTGGVSGVLAGAYFGAQVGIAMGPLGAIAGTVPGAILGGLFGKNIGDNYDKPQCPKCSTSFKIDNFNFFIADEDNFALLDLLFQNWNENISRGLKEILEIHIIFKRLGIEPDFSCSIHYQFKQRFGKEYKFQNKTDYSALISLTKLNLRTSYKIEDVNFIQYLRNIKAINLYSDASHIQGINYIQDLVNLEYIHLYTPNIDDLGFLNNAKNLRDLIIISADPKDYAFLRGLNKLEQLSFSPLHLKTNHPVFNLKNLVSLDLGNCSVVENENSFLQISKLKYLTAFFVEIRSIEFLKKLQLKEIKARKGNLSNDQIMWIHQNVEKVLLL